MNTLKIPVVEPHEKANAVSVWEWSGSAFDEGEEASKWFTDFLGKPCRLVRFDEGSLCYISGRVSCAIASIFSARSSKITKKLLGI